MYTDPNFKSKKDLKLWLAMGKDVLVYAPGLGSVPVNGPVSLEGPHFPKPHTWYAEGVMKDGKLISVK